MTRAYDASSFEEEKEAVIARAESLSNPSLPSGPETLKGKKEFAAEFAKASAELRDDQEAALAACRVDGNLLKDCSETRRDDFEVASLAVRHFGFGLIHASARLRGNKEVVLLAVQSHGEALEHASADLRGDEGVVVEAMKSSWNAIRYASESVKRSKDVALKLVAIEPCILGHLDDALKADREVVERALSLAGAYMPEVWDIIDPAIHDKELVLLAVRGTLECDIDLGRYCYDEAAGTVQWDVSWDHLLGAAESALAMPGEEAPVLTVRVRKLVADSPYSPDNYACEARLLSGTIVSCSLPDVLIVDDYGNGRAGPMVSTLAKELLHELEEHSQGDDPKVLHLVFSVGEDVQPVTPWDWERSLHDFVSAEV